MRHFQNAVLALHLVAHFATYIRLTALLRMFAADFINPESSIPDLHHVLIVSLFEKEVATKSGYDDETVTLDGTVCTALGSLLKRQASHIFRKTENHASISRTCSFGTFKPKAFWTLRKACEHVQFDTDTTTIYHARYGGASRDLMLGTRTMQDVTLHLFAWLVGSCVLSTSWPGSSSWSRQPTITQYVAKCTGRLREVQLQKLVHQATASQVEQQC